LEQTDQLIVSVMDVIYASESKDITYRQTSIRHARSFTSTI